MARQEVLAQLTKPTLNLKVGGCRTGGSGLCSPLVRKG